MERQNSYHGKTRPFSSNNPFRNASADSFAAKGGDTAFQRWVQTNQSAMSFSSDDEEEALNGLRPPPPVSGRDGSRSESSTRSSSDHSSRNGSASAIGGRRGGQDDALPPSYEEVAGSRAGSGYPREKEGQYAQTTQHRTRVHKEWPGDDKRDRERETRPHREHSSSSRDHRKERSSHHHHRERSDSHRDRERSHRSRDKKSKKKEVVPPKNVDTIDKLDVTSVFGGAFHHDGPFDACTPHRNKNQKSAPVLAFPADGPNNSIRGVGAVNKDATLNYIQGRREDEDDDLYTTSVASQNYSRTYKNDSQSTLAAVKPGTDITQFDANMKAEPVHGQTTLGLGSSTFLDGAPVAAKTLEEEQSKQYQSLGRKKSLKQRITGDAPPAGTNGQRDEDKESNSLLKRVKSLKVGRK